MIKTVRNLKMEFNKEIESWKRTHNEMKMEFKYPITQAMQS